MSDIVSFLARIIIDLADSACVMLDVKATAACQAILVPTLLMLAAAVFSMCLAAAIFGFCYGSKMAFDKSQPEEIKPLEKRDA